MFKLTLKLITAALIILLLGMLPQVTTAQEDDPFYHDYLLENGVSFEAEFKDDINMHLYAFLASRGDVVTIQMTQLDPDTNRLDPYLILLSDTGEVIAVDDDGGDLFLSAALKDIRIPEDGVYFIIASDSYGRRFSTSEYLNDSDVRMPYTLSVTGINEPDEFDEPDFRSLTYG
ncbi:MAG: hypothetical protein CUN56_13455, partial [Phototrophicales bacterium]